MPGELARETWGFFRSNANGFDLHRSHALRSKKTPIVRHITAPEDLSLSCERRNGYAAPIEKLLHVSRDIKSFGVGVFQ